MKLTSLKILLIKMVLFSNFVWIFEIHAQNNPNTSESLVVPPSPNVAALQKYVDYPVSLATGVADINIPIYTIDLKGFKYPIALSYHASGIKVNDIASDVGLGWSISAGGMLNINANGLLDEQSNYGNQHAYFQKIKDQNMQGGYSGGSVACNQLYLVYNSTLPFNNLLQLYADVYDMSFLRSVIYNGDDSEPDLYTYFTANGGGKFFQDDNGVFRTIPASDNRIVRTVVGGVITYKITDAQGVVYEFGLWQGNHSTTLNHCTGQASLADEHWGREYYLTKITTPKGEYIDFHYTGVPLYSYKLTNQYSRSKYQSYPCIENNTQGLGYAYDCYSVTEISQSPFRLSQITTSNGLTIDLTYSGTDRKDIALRSLDGITISRSSGILQTFTLGHDYFYSASPSSTDPADYRLKLTSVQQTGMPAYEFTYSNIVLPNRMSLSLDHYGYYNGKNNNTLIPADPYWAFDTGGDRSCDSTMVKGDLLTEIKYPTGGKTVYSYEPNRYWVAYNTDTYVAGTGGNLISLPDQTVNASFTVPYNSNQLKIHYENSWDGVNLYNDYCKIRVTGPNGFDRYYYNTNQAGEVLYVVGGSTINAGSYTVSIETAGSTYAGNVYFTWVQPDVIPPHNETGGGVRVKQIRSFSSTNAVAFVKKFEYTVPGTSQESGVSLLPPRYTEQQDNTWLQLSGETGNCFQVNCMAMTQSSGNLNPLFFSDGYSVTYSDVRQYDVDPTQNGYTHSVFNSSYNGNIGQAITFPQAPLISYDWMLGKLLKQDTYRYNGSNYIKIHTQQNTYNYDYFNTSSPYLYTTYGAKIAMYHGPDFCRNCGNGDYSPLNAILTDISFGIKFYRYYSSWFHLDQTEATTYDLNGQNPSNVTTKYFYDNPAHLQLTRTSFKKSDGTSLTTAMVYPEDYSSGTSFIDDMVASHQIGIPIEKVSYLENGTAINIVGGSVTAYKPGGKGLVDTQYQLETTAPVSIVGYKFSDRNTGSLPFGGTTAGFLPDGRYKPRQTVQLYDDAGNPLQVATVGGPSSAYLWGYNKQYPVAEVKNSTYQEILNVLGQTVIDQLTGNNPGDDNTVRSLLAPLRGALPNALVTVLSYKPLIGMTSLTDPRGETTYYEYDALQRLKIVRDSKGNIIKQMDYHYQDQ